MLFEELELAGLYRVELEPRIDQRGFFSRLFCTDAFERAGLNPSIVQVNNTLTKERGSVRGLHFQRPPKAETKLVRCVRGAVWDVAVDLRAGSPTFGKWASLELTEENRTMVYIPHGFAHGFQTLQPSTELIYFHSEEYSAECEGAVSPADRQLNINWPLQITCMSDRDQNHPTLDELEPIAI